MELPTYIIGIDEAGRGPLAGPVSVGAVKVSSDFDIAFFDGIRDSKQISERVREEWFARIKGETQIAYAVSLISASVIDRSGIVPSVRLGIARVLSRLAADPKTTMVYLDGGIKAPEAFSMQETIIKGDTLVPLISAGAIMAKVTRDRYMQKIAPQYPQYGLEIHKGYGTKAHREAIFQFGPSKIHRKSFLSGFVG